MEEVGGESEEWTFQLAEVVEELKVEELKVVESWKIVAWPAKSWSIDSIECPRAC